MAIGDITVFDQFGADKGQKIHDLDTDTFKAAFVTLTAPPTDATAGPHFGGTGTTDLSTNEVTPGGNYSAGGITMTTLTYDNAAGVISWKADKLTQAQHASNPTDARWIVIYNSSDANKRCVCFCDLGADVDTSSGPFEFRFNSVDGNGTVMTDTIN